MEQICGECKWHRTNTPQRGWICNNEESEYFALDTDYTDTCDEWEGRE